MKNESQTYETLQDKFSTATSITITQNNEKTTYLKGNDKYELLLESLLLTTKDAQDMPAFGVSLDNETKSAITKGTWLELEFTTPQNFNEMPFDALLIEVVKDFEGINIIRKNNGTYEGRCFYLNLKSNMKELSNTISNISK